jgi:hypothetical protein
MKTVPALLLAKALLVTLQLCAQNPNGKPPVFPTPLNCPTNAPFNPELAMQYAHSPAPTGDILVVVAHRGYWENPNSAENSPSAMVQAQQNCIEAVEIDLRLTSDQRLAPLHDYSIQRVTNGTGSVSNTTYATWTGLSTRNRYGQVLNSPTPTFGDTNLPTTRDILDTLLYNPTLMLVIDCKDNLGMSPNSYVVLQKAYAAILAWDPEFGPIILSRILFKARLPDLPASPTTILSDLGITKSCKSPYTSTCENFNLAPIVFPNDACSASPTATCVTTEKLQAYLQLPLYGGVTPSTYSFLWYPEFGVPYPQDVWQPYIGSASGTNTTRQYIPSDDWPEGGSQSFGTCCTLRNTSPAPVATTNYAGDLEYVFSQSFGHVNTDKAFEAMSYFQAQGLRNVCRLTSAGC